MKQIIECSRQEVSEAGDNSIFAARPSRDGTGKTLEGYGSKRHINHIS